MIEADLLDDDFIPFDSEPQEIKNKTTTPLTKLQSQSFKKTSLDENNKKDQRSVHVLRLNVPWLSSKPDETLHPTEYLNREIVSFASYVSPTDAERQARFSAIQRLHSTLESVLGTDVTLVSSQTLQKARRNPNQPELFVFGSYDSDLFLPTSDIDTVLMLCGSHAIPRLMQKIANTLIRDGVPEKDSLQVISKAKVPIVKYRDSLNAFEVDLSFDAFGGVEAAFFMRRAMIEQPAIRPLVLVLKFFLRMRGLNTVFTGGLGSYSLMCLVIAFLKTHPLVQAGLITANNNLGVLLLDFLQLHGKNFNYETVGISLDENGVQYYEKVEKGWVNESRPGLLSIQDPQDPTNDIARGSFGFQSARQAFDHAFCILQASMREFSDHQMSLRGRKDTVTPSILGSIISLEDDLLLHRYYIQNSAKSF